MWLETALREGNSRGSSLISRESVPTVVLDEFFQLSGSAAPDSLITVVGMRNGETKSLSQPGLTLFRYLY